jgi:diamine N-acetyltransferase
MLFEPSRYDLGTGLGLCPLYDAVVAAGELVSIDPWERLGFDQGALERYLTRLDPCLYRYTIEHNGRSSGLICIRYPWLRGPYIELFAVFPKAQRKGIGGAVIDWVDKLALGREKNLWVAVSSFNEAARRFYEGKGFRYLADIPDLVRAGEAEILMRKLL